MKRSSLSHFFIKRSYALIYLRGVKRRYRLAGVVLGMPIKQRYRLMYVWRAASYAAYMASRAKPS
jgi:hypothetical protein